MATKRTNGNQKSKKASANTEDALDLNDGTEDVLGFNDVEPTDDNDVEPTDDNDVEPTDDNIDAPPDVEPTDDNIDDEEGEPTGNQMIIVKSVYRGLLYASPMQVDPNAPALTRSGKGKSIHMQLGYNEVEADVYEACKSQLDKAGVKPYGRAVKNGRVVTMAFNQFDPQGQRNIAKNCNDVKSLSRWKTLPGIDSSVMAAINDRLAKINNWPAKKG
jgi:hypothetical protein